MVISTLGPSSHQRLTEYPASAKCKLNEVIDLEEIDQKLQVASAKSMGRGSALRPRKTPANERVGSCRVGCRPPVCSETACVL